MIALSAGTSNASSELLALVKVLAEEGIEKQLEELHSLLDQVQSGQAELDVAKAAFAQQQAEADAYNKDMKATYEAQEQSLADKFTELAKQVRDLADSNAALKLREFDQTEKEKVFAEFKQRTEDSFVGRENVVSGREQFVAEKQTVVDALALKYNTKLAAITSAIG